MTTKAKWLAVFSVGLLILSVVNSAYHAPSWWRLLSGFAWGFGIGVIMDRRTRRA